MCGLDCLLKPSIIWCLIGLALFIMEFTLPGLIVFFFGLGAMVVSVTCLFVTMSLNMQLGLFLVASVALLLALRHWLKGVFTGHTKGAQDLHLDLQDFAGGIAEAKTDLQPGTPGKVEYHGTEWNAETDEVIPAGTSVEVTGRKSLTLTVKTRT